ncbi:hypothetical protein LFT45_16825 [Arthrobacter sp. FW305-BF8]|uniref:hypothetical protein n=1 Tax=Arthrobacter sp. FW305-BF8 TaxID=2879617 RepID=UPI001F1AA6AC|nr:hypothetical protein [Arthrobacter sp. FW305-BF8]UKA53372.1 hypothetical protein LFT45_16825 [Arthrobacter sp. FW305-BF8]
MTTEPAPPEPDPTADPDRERLSRREKALLFLNSRRRRFWAVFTLIVSWFLLEILFDRSPVFPLSLVPNLFLYGGGALLVVLWTNGAILNQPAPLPVGIMRNTATTRFMNEETWETDLSRTQAQDALVRLFQQPGTEARVIGKTVWVQLGKEWHAEEWWHRDAAPHMKRTPPVHFFLNPTGSGTAITAFSQDRRLAGMHDVVRLSDEMSATAVKLARDATERPDDDEGRER